MKTWSKNKFVSAHNIIHETDFIFKQCKSSTELVKYTNHYLTLDFRTFLILFANKTPLIVI